MEIICKVTSVSKLLLKYFINYLFIVEYTTIIMSYIWNTICTWEFIDGIMKTGFIQIGNSHDDDV